MEGTDAAAGRVVVVGSVNADLVLSVDRHPSPGETVLGRGGSVLPGGKGANQAVAAARLGARVAMVGAVGDDAHAAAATSGLRAAGVDVTAVETVPGPTGLAVVAVAADGENSIVVVPGANASVTGERVRQVAGLLVGADVVVLQGELDPAATEAAARLAARAGVRVVLNLAPAVALAADVVRLADPLVVNEHEAPHALALLGAAGDGLDGTALAAALRAAGAASAVVTLGGAGAAVAAGSVERVPAPRVDVVDTTGAGDAFVGALAARLAAGEDLVAAARTAVRVGAFAVRGEGAQPSYPSLDDDLP